MKIKSTIHILCALSLLVGVVSTSFVSQAAPTVGTISGTVTYNGDHDPNHDVFVAAHLVIDDEPVASVHILGPGDYSLDNLPDGSYYISAFLDLNDSGGGPPDSVEPSGMYDSDGDGNPDQVTVSGGNFTGIDIELTDVYIAVQGTACYLGGVHGPGQIEIGLHTAVGVEPVFVQYAYQLCSEYFFGEVSHGAYYVSLFYNVDGASGPPDPGEPIGWYDADGDGNPDPIIYTGNVITDVNITVGGIHYVDFSAAGTEEGASWENAYLNPQDAFAAAEPGEEIWVAAGIYTPGSNRDDSFVLKHGVAVYGGFNGTENYRYQRNWRANTTVLSGEIGSPSIKTDNVYHVVQTASTYLNPLDETAILDGFTISGGYAGSPDNPHDKGGGFLNDFGYPTLVNLNFIGNYAYNHGGAIATQYNSESLTIINSTFSGNSATNNAGGIANLSNLKVVNSSFIGNMGGAGGGIVGLSGTHTEVYNSIFWGNQGNDISLQGTATATVTYSIVEGGFVGGSNILVGNPSFVDADGPDNIYGTLDDDLHLQGISPAIDAGDNTELLGDDADSDGNGNTSETTPLDMDGGRRLIDDPGTPDTGNGSSPIVDMGADEYAAPVTIAGLRAVTSRPTLLSETTLFSARVINGTHITYDWNFGDGVSSSGSLPAHTYAASGAYQVVLTATNSLGSQQVNTTVTVGEVMTANPGDSVTTSDGTLTFEIPSSITSTMTLTYTPQTTPTHSLGDFDFGGLVFQLLATDGNGAIIEPGTPITLTIHYDESALPPGTDEANLELRRYDEGSGQWVALTILSRDPSNDTITVLLDHFSEFALLAESAVNNAPTANFADQTTVQGETVMLDGTLSSDIDGDTLDFHWTQTGGTAVTFTDNISQPTFIAPAAPATLTFSLTVTDTGGLSDDHEGTVWVVGGDASTVVLTDTETIFAPPTAPFTITVPAGGVSQPISLIFTDTVSGYSPPAGLQFMGDTFSLAAYIDGLLQPGFTFDTPFTITLSYSDDDIDGFAEDTLTLLYWDGSAWASDGIVLVSHSPSENQITFTVNHLTDFAFVAEVATEESYSIYLPLVLK